VRSSGFAALGPALLAGPLGADVGADVLCVDRASAPFAAYDVNRVGKRSVAVNLKSADGRQASRDLLATADVLIEGFRPGVMERLGLGPADCPPELIYGRMTGWGQQGPLAHKAGHDLTYLAQSGVLSLLGTADAPPKPPLNLIADYGGGSLFLAFGVLSAVIARVRTGAGQIVDAAMVDGVPAMMGLLHGMMAQGSWAAPPGENWLDGGAPFYRCYRCADGRDIAVGALEPQFFAALLDGMGIDPATLPDQNDRRAWPEMRDRFARIFATRGRDEWVSVFAERDACVAPVLTLAEARADAHMASRGTYAQVGDVWQAAPAPRLSQTPGRTPMSPTAPGADTDSVLRDVGYDDARLAHLRSAGVLT
ncbi:MAG: CaiB/BaiF CoA transferase family protein, partial [Tateyamaria sp.]